MHKRGDHVYLLRKGHQPTAAMVEHQIPLPPFGRYRVRVESTGRRYNVHRDRIITQAQYQADWKAL